MSRHLRIPLALGADGQFVTHPEDSLEEVAQNVETVLTTRLGERQATPDLGTPDPTFRGLDVDAALDAALRWEPRADLELVDRLLDGTGLETTTVRVRRED